MPPGNPAAAGHQIPHQAPGVPLIFHDLRLHWLPTRGTAAAQALLSWGGQEIAQENRKHRSSRHVVELFRKNWVEGQAHDRLDIAQTVMQPRAVPKITKNFQSPGIHASSLHDQVSGNPKGPSVGGWSRECKCSQRGPWSIEKVEGGLVEEANNPDEEPYGVCEGRQWTQSAHLGNHPHHQRRSRFLIYPSSCSSIPLLLLSLGHSAPLRAVKWGVH